MASTLLLERTLATTLTWNKARINFVAKFLLALLQVKTVNLAQIAAVLSGRATPDSHYKRCQRFFAGFALPFAEIADLVITWLALQPPFMVSIDRTDWYLGNTPLNILMLSVVHQGVAVPLLWAVLEKKGCSDTAERIALLESYGQQFGAASLAYVMADREFIGNAWFAYLQGQQIAFRIRLKENLLVSTANGRRQVAARNLFRQQAVGVGVLLSGKRRVLGQELYLMGMRQMDGEYVIVASNEASESILQEYGERWKIETLFGSLKSRGFCLEATHITDKERLAKLVALLTVAFCWALVVGEWLCSRQPLKVKAHGRLAKSRFRCGLDHLRRLVCNLADRLQMIAWQKVILLLSGT